MGHRRRVARPRAVGSRRSASLDGAQDGSADADGLASGDASALARGEASGTAGAVGAAGAAGSADAVGSADASAVVSAVASGFGSGLGAFAGAGLVGLAAGAAAGSVVAAGVLCLGPGAAAGAAGRALGRRAADLVGRVCRSHRDVDRIPPDARLDAVRECLPILDLERDVDMPLVPADGSRLMSGVLSTSLVPISVGSSGISGSRPPPVDVEPALRADPAAPARTSLDARPVFITIERVNPDVAVSVSIWAT